LASDRSEGSGCDRPEFGGQCPETLERKDCLGEKIRCMRGAISGSEENRGKRGQGGIRKY